VPKFIVTQTLCRERIIEVEALSADAARDLAARGYGEIIVSASCGPLALLCDSAERKRDA
jgi:hypothetical protein